MKNADEIIETGVTVVHDAMALDDAAKTELQIVEVDLFKLRDLKCNLRVNAKIVTGATAPGTTKTLTLVWFWSDVPVASASVKAQLAARKASADAITLDNNTATTLFYDAAGPIAVESRYLYLGVTQDALDTGATLALTTYLSATFEPVPAA